MAKKMAGKGLDGRHRDTTGRIDKKHGNTRIGSLRKTYGEHFAKGRRKDMMLKNLLAETGTVLAARLFAQAPQVTADAGTVPVGLPGGCRPFSVCAFFSLSLFRAALPAASATTRRICGNHGTKWG